jgi:tRNA-2-methylthio-N6-dimethylallyladenosine synthase
LAQYNAFLIEGVSWKDGKLLAGKTDNNRVVDIEGNAKLIHQFVYVKITDVSNPRRLVGRIIE